MKKGNAKYVAMYGVLIALAFIFSYLESLIPVHLVVPGIKIGLANIVVLMALYLMDWKAAIVLSVIRVLLASFTFGNLSMFWFSLSGALLSFLTMAFLKRTKGFSIVGVSVAGGVAHNIGQIIVAMIVLSKSIVYYLFLLVIGGTITGTVIGMIGAVIYQKLKPAFDAMKPGNQ